MITHVDQIVNYRYNPEFHCHITTEKESQQAWNYPEQCADLMYMIEQPPIIYSKFKLSVSSSDPDRIIYNPNAELNGVFISPRYISHKIFKEISRKKYIYQLEFDYLVCAGYDNHLSEKFNILEQYQHLFKHIYYEAKNIKCGWIQTLPMGITTAYMLRNGGNAILQHVNGPKNKNNLIGAAFYSRWTPETLGFLPERADLTNFMSTNDLMQDMRCDPLEFYERLSEFAFFASPIGCGMQTPKLFECILCETVPVVIEHYVHRELHEIYGFPMIIVNEWSDVTSQLLEDWYSKNYDDIDWSEQKSKILVDNIKDVLDMAIGFDITKIWNKTQIRVS